MDLAAPPEYAVMATPLPLSRDQCPGGRYQLRNPAGAHGLWDGATVGKFHRHRVGGCGEFCGESLLDVWEISCPGRSLEKTSRRNWGPIVTDFSFSWRSLRSLRFKKHQNEF